MATTYVNIGTSGQSFPFPSTGWSVDQLRSTLSDSVPGIGGMDAEDTGVSADGNRTITFRPRTGTKG